MSISLSPRRPLATALAFSVIVGGLAFAPATAAVAATTAQNQTTVLTAINNARTALSTEEAPVNALASSAALTKIAQTYATASAAKGKVTTAPTAITVDANAEAPAPTFKFSVGQISSKSKASAAYAKLSAATVTDATYDFAGVGYATKGTKTFVVALVADYATAPLETQYASTPKITGSAKVGKTLTASTKFATEPGSYGFTWFAGGELVGEGDNFFIRADQRGKTITVKLTSVKDGYKDLVLTSKATAKVVTGTIDAQFSTVYGTRNVNATLYTYWDVRNYFEVPNYTATQQWYRGTSKIEGATSYYYTQTEEDKGKKIWSKTTISAPGFGTVSHSTTKTVATKAKLIQNVSNVYINEPTAPIAVGTVLSVNTGDWSKEYPAFVAANDGIKLSVQWYANDKAIKGATKTTFKITSAQIDSYITAKVTGTVAGYDKTVRATNNGYFLAGKPFTKKPTASISGTFATGKTLVFKIGNLQKGAKTTFYWYDDNDKLVKNTTGKLKLTSSQVKSGGVYAYVEIRVPGYTNQYGGFSAYFTKSGNTLYNNGDL